MATEYARRVLVVDDEPPIRALLEAALTGAGYSALTAEHGAAALDALRRQPEMRLHLVLTDLDMPVMGGEEFVRAYRRLPGPHAPVVVLSGALDAEQRATEVGAAALLRKPFRVGELLAVVARVTAE